MAQRKGSPRKKAQKAAKRLGSGMAGRAAKKIGNRRSVMNKRMKDIYK